MKQVRNTPLNRLYLAINHYISTGDHIGEGISNDLGSHIQMMVAVNQANPTDQQDFRNSSLASKSCKKSFLRHWCITENRRSPDRLPSKSIRSTWILLIWMN